MQKVRDRRKKREIHGMSNTVEYHAWDNAIKRCYRKSYGGYKNYGGRGIGLCDRWRNSFLNFYADMGKRPSENHSLDRIDTNKDYSPENCKWSTAKEQANNKRNNIHVEYKGKKWVLTELLNHVGLKYSTYYSRISRGLTMLEAIEKPVMIRNKK